MKYAALLTNLQEDSDAWKRPSAEEAQAAKVPMWEALLGELAPTGVVAFGVDSPSTAKTVRVRDGEVLVSDGPFAETKEQIGGLVEIEAEDLDAAIAIAARIPVALRGSVELRPVIEH